MQLLDSRPLEDAQWQLDHAVQILSPFLADLSAAVEREPTDPAQRARYEKSAAFLRALNTFFAANSHLILLLNERDSRRDELMAEAEFNYHQLRLSHDYFKREAQTLGQRYYRENDIINQAIERLRNHSSEQTTSPHQSAA